MAPSASGLSRQSLKLESSVRIWQESLVQWLGKCLERKTQLTNLFLSYNFLGFLLGTKTANSFKLRMI